MISPQPVAPDLIDEGCTHLIAGRHRATGQLVFPFPSGDLAKDFDQHKLASDGLLWSYTVQRFRPKSPPYRGPLAFVQYAVGYVELQNELIVESRLTGIPFEDLRIGLPVTLTTELISFFDDDTPRLSFAFTCTRSA